MTETQRTPGWQHEIVGWGLATAGPALITGGFAVYLWLGREVDVDQALWLYGALVVASALSGFAVWIRGSCVYRKAKRQASNKPTN